MASWNTRILILLGGRGRGRGGGGWRGEGEGRSRQQDERGLGGVVTHVINLQNINVQVGVEGTD